MKNHKNQVIKLKRRKKRVQGKDKKEELWNYVLLEKQNKSDLR